MNGHISSKRSMAFISFLCCLVYFTSYLTRLNYGACLIEIQRALQIDKSQAGLPVTGCFLVYGIGQLICGYIGDKIAPQKIIFTGLVGSALCNLLVAVFPRIAVITLIWSVNGFFQSMLWPPLVRIMAELLDGKWYRHCSVLVSFSSSLATVAVYLLAPVCLFAWGWKSMFFLPAVAGILTAVYWIVNIRSQGRETIQEENPSTPVPEEPQGGIIRLFLLAPLFPMLTAIALHGVLKDGITTWMPAYMADAFGTSTSTAILTTAILPVFAICSTLFSSLLYNRIRDELCTAALLFAAGFAGSTAMFFTNARYPIGCVLLMMLITGCMHGINLMLISRLPRHFVKFGMVSTVSGILNAATYVGSALSTYVFGKIAENSGWNHVILLWIAVSGIATILLLGCRRKWKSFLERKDIG